VVDAYTHVMEQYLTYPHEGYLQDRIAGILQTLIEIGPVVEPKDYALASNFMWSTMALNGLIQKACLGQPLVN
jgi:NADP-dependent alcohol dehydrogenase